MSALTLVGPGFKAPKKKDTASMAQRVRDLQADLENETRRADEEHDRAAELRARVEELEASDAATYDLGHDEGAEWARGVAMDALRPFQDAAEAILARHYTDRLAPDLEDLLERVAALDAGGLR